LPFFQLYVLPFSCKFGTLNSGTFSGFKELLVSFKQKKHLDKTGLIHCITLAYNMNPLSKGKKRKRSLDEIINFIS
jgi:hypothetical protein